MIELGIPPDQVQLIKYAIPVATSLIGGGISYILSRWGKESYKYTDYKNVPVGVVVGAIFGFASWMFIR